MSDIQKFRTQIKNGLLEYITLLLLQKGEFYSSEIIETFKEYDLIVVEGTLYPLLSRMKKKGYIKYYWKESQSGPPRKYFYISQLGRDYLEEMDEIWQGFRDSIESIKKFI